MEDRSYYLQSGFRMTLLFKCLLGIFITTYASFNVHATETIQHKNQELWHHFVEAAKYGTIELTFPLVSVSNTQLKNTLRNRTQEIFHTSSTKQKFCVHFRGPFGRALRRIRDYVQLQSALSKWCRSCTETDVEVMELIQPLIPAHFAAIIKFTNRGYSNFVAHKFDMLIFPLSMMRTHKSNFDIIQEKIKKAETNNSNPPFQARIVGGNVVFPKFKYGFMTSLQSQYLGHFCGGSLISPNTVITAAHCVFGKGTNFSVHLNRHDLNDENELLKNNSTYNDVEKSLFGSFSNVRRVMKVHIYDKFDPITLDNDIAIVTLVATTDKSTVAIDEFQTIDLDYTYLNEESSTLPSNDTLYGFSIYGHNVSSHLIPSKIDLTGKVATVIGWGRLTENGYLSPLLLKAQVPFVSDDECHRSYGSDFNSEVMFCAGYPNGGIDSCTGDSGGPLFIESANDDNIESTTTNYRKLIGIVSWGQGCGRKNKYGVYTKISYFKEFIKMTLEKAENDFRSDRVNNQHIQEEITQAGDKYNILENLDDSSRNCIDIVVSIVPDRYPEDIMWKINDCAGFTITAGTLISSSPLLPSISKVTVCEKDIACIGTMRRNEYQLILEDAFGDGFCCRHGMGSFSISIDNGNPDIKNQFAVNRTAGNIGSFRIIDFTLHLRKLTKRKNRSMLSLENEATQKENGSKVDLYIIDSPIDETLKGLKDTVIKSPPARETGFRHCNHGTSMAHIAREMSRRALIKGYVSDILQVPTLEIMTIHEIPVFDCDGYASSWDICMALQDVYQRIHKQNTNLTSIILMAFGGTAKVKDPIIDNCIQTIFKGVRREKDVFLVASSGNNDNDNACKYSPGNNNLLLTVGSINKDGFISSYSNVGPCVDIYAYGNMEDVIKDQISDGITFMNGTSVSAAVIAGISANLIYKYQFDANHLRAHLLNESNSYCTLNPNFFNSSSGALSFCQGSLNLTMSPSTRAYRTSKTVSSSILSESRNVTMDSEIESVSFRGMYDQNGLAEPFCADDDLFFEAWVSIKSTPSSLNLRCYLMQTDFAKGLAWRVVSLSDINDTVDGTRNNISNIFHYAAGGSGCFIIAVEVLEGNGMYLIETGVFVAKL